MNQEQIVRMADGLVEAQKSALREALRPLVEEIRTLKAKVAELEQRPTLKYHGVWRAEQHYIPGDFVTVAGAVWHCRVANHGLKPDYNEHAAKFWQLAVKRGSDGRDGRDASQ